MNRRHFLAGGATAALGLLGSSCFALKRVARAPEPDGPLSAEALALVAKSWEGLDPSRTLDVHAHVVGLGAGGTGCWVNPKLQELTRPFRHMRFHVYVTAAGVTDLKKADEQYVARLVSLVRGQPSHGRLLLLAFDHAYREDGTQDLEASEFYTPNAYTLRLAQEYPDCFLAACSVHPYRKDAVEALEWAVGQGARAVKWLPNAQLIDPGNPRCDPFYRKMAELQVPLLTHAGEEKAVEAEEYQKFGNPLLLRRALDAGVKVIVAHCASLGTNEDLDARDRPQVDNFELFLRMMEDPKYQDRLYGEVSAMLQWNRATKLVEVLKRPALHPRLMNGTDYPLPAINAVLRTGELVKLGLLTEAQRTLLNELDQHNPLAFDFAVKRTVRYTHEGKELRLPDSLFSPVPGLFPGLG